MALETQIALFTATIGIIGFVFLFFNGRHRDVNRKIETQDKEIDDVKLNYLDRFDDVKKTIYENKMEITDKVNTNKDEILTRINELDKTTTSMFGNIQTEIAKLTKQ